MVAATPRQGALEYVKNEPGCFISQGNDAVNLASAIVSALDVGKVANLNRQIHLTNLKDVSDKAN